MKNHRLKIAIFASSLLLSSCGERERDVKYYLDNPDIRAETLSKCSERSKYNIPEINCKNADQARHQVFIQGKG